LLVVALAALGGAGLRLAGRLGADGLQRIVAAAPIATSFAVLEALGLGLVSRGSSPWLLSAAAILTWGAVRVSVDSTRPPTLTATATAWWARRTRAERIAAGGAAGLWVAICAWLVANPTIGIDAALYHLNDVAAWVHNGRPGSTVALSYDLPFGSYPLTNEVALAWLAGISRGFAAPTLWSPTLYLLMIAAGWVGLRALDVPARVTGLCLAAVATVPVLLQQIPTAGTDLPGVCWLAVCAALVACSAARPGLLSPALLAGGLAVGTKTTAVPLVVLALAAGAWIHRSRLRGLAATLAPAVVGAGVIGGLWYVRDFVDHGSPLWPFLSLHGGDPVPSFLVPLRPSFLSRPLATLHGPVKVYRDSYTWQLSGAWVLLAGGLLAGLVSRRRPVMLAAGAVGLGLLAWANAPITGAPANPALWELTASTNRYVLPVLVAAGLAIGLLGRAGRHQRTVAVGLLGVGLVVNVAGASKYAPTSIELPPAVWIVLGAAAGVAVALAAGPVGHREHPGSERPPARRPARAAVAGAGLVGGLGLALALAWGSAGFLGRSVAAADAPFVGPVAWFDAQPGYLDGSAPIAMADLTVATLAGDRYQHPLELIAADAPCAAVRAWARTGWVVVTTFAFPGFRSFTAARCLAGERALDTDVGYAVYGPAST
ncbi:MAG TPA: hypothetical protein VHW26_05415, partial [Solirubrobacteraceae bacterium]|nr:hypothetical protein [Solirubrobacteraceae bacterium]